MADAPCPDLAALRGVLARLEAAEGPNVHRDIELWVRLGSAEVRDMQWSDRLPTDPRERCNGMTMWEAVEAGVPAVSIRSSWKVPALTTSLDAAVALVERCGFGWQIDRDEGCILSDADDCYDLVKGATPTLSACTALCRALIALAETEAEDAAR